MQNRHEILHVFCIQTDGQASLICEEKYYYYSQLNLKIMLRWTVIFLIVAIIAGIFGFTGIAAGAAEIAKVLFYIFLVLFVLSLLFGRRTVD